MSRPSVRLRRVVAVAAVAVVAASFSGPAYAKDGFEAKGSGATQGTVRGTKTTTDVRPAHPIRLPGAPDLPGLPGQPQVMGAAAAACVGAVVGVAAAAAGMNLLGLPPAVINANGACAQTPAGEAAPAVPVITTEMVTQAATVTAPSNPPHVEPGRRSFVNIPNNYWTETATVRDSVTVLGTTIPLQWTPTSTTWSFGDGTTATGNGIRSAAVGQAGAVEHAYRRQGSYAITTSTSYDLTFLLPGQGSQTIQLTAPPSPAVTLPVREIQTRTSYVG